MDGRQYLPTVAWSFKVRNVIFLTPETINTPATFRCDAVPFDSSEPGANDDKEIGFYVTDNVGNIYSVIGVGTYTVDLSDDFRCGVGPQTGKWAVLSKSVGNGIAPFLTPIHYRRLDKSAIDNVRRIELDILWKHRLFTYTAYASDAEGTSFTLINDMALAYMAVLVSPVEIVTPVVDHFVGLWRPSHPPVTIAEGSAERASIDTFTQELTINPIDQIQSDWEETDPTKKSFIKRKPEIPEVDNSVTVRIDFQSLDTFTYTCPCALKFTAQESESTAATLSVSLNTNMAKYQDLTVTPTDLGLIILTGEQL